MSLSILVNCSVGLQFYITFTFIYTTHKKMSKIKTILTDSQPGYVLRTFLYININYKYLENRLPKTLANPVFQRYIS